MPPSQFVDDFDDDGLDYEEDGDYGEGEGLSAEDEAAMTQGTAEVRKALGKDSTKVTLKQIQDALWHYYYDVEKSVAYLNKTFIAPPPAKPAAKPTPAKKAPEGMSRTFSFSAAYCSFGETSGANHQCYAAVERERSKLKRTGFPILEKPRPSGLSFFDDMPWLRTPPNRQTTFYVPVIPSGGLLGGGDSSAGMSKLQKLAAARKKKLDEKKGQDKTAQTENGIRQLSISNSSQKENLAPTNPLVKRQKLSKDDPTPPLKQIPSQTTENQVIEESEKASSSSSSVTSQDADSHGMDESTAVRTTPSSFARTLFGSAPESPRKKGRDVFPMPYTTSASFSSSIFSEPSPDDIVLAAQSKGSNFANAK